MRKLQEALSQNCATLAKNFVTKKTHHPKTIRNQEVLGRFILKLSQISKF